MSREPERYWVHSQDHIVDDDPDPSELPTPGSGLCSVPERGGPCTYPDGNPRKALDGSIVCGRHTTLAGVWLAELPELWETLGDPTRVGGKPLGSWKRTDAPAPSTDAMLVRDQIERVLITIERTIHDLTRTPVTSEETVRAESRRLAEEASTALKGVATEQVLFERVRDGKTGATQADRDKAATRAGEARKYADDLRQRWSTLDSRARSGRDVIDARAERVGRYLERLLAEPDHAVQVVTAIRAVHQDAVRAVDPYSPGIGVACPTCGTRVRLRWDEDITCPGEVEGPDGMEPCPEHGVAEWWARQLGVDLRQALTADEAVAWLWDTHRIRVEVGTIWSWASASRRKITGSTEVRDGRHVTVYSPLELLDAATSQRPRTGAAS